jgi:hypothetical protein
VIYPEDYKAIGLTDEERPGDPVYFATQYLISREGPRLYRVSSRGEGFMRKLQELELIASGPEIAWYQEKVDTRSRARLIELASELCKDGVTTVVFQGPDEHVTFVHDPDPGEILLLEVLDVSPPDPPWLVHVINNLERCGVLGDLTVRFKARILDLRGFQGEEVYYPCRASGLGRALDSDRVVHDRPRIVGCEISREIFLATNPGKEHEFVNICPLSSLVPEGPFITRCCRSERRGFTSKNGHRGIVVHWGDGPYLIAEAVRRLVGSLK